MHWQPATLSLSGHQVCESLAKDLLQGSRYRAAAHRIKGVVIKIPPRLLHRSHNVLLITSVRCLIWVDLQHLPCHALLRSER